VYKIINIKIIVLRSSF